MPRRGVRGYSFDSSARGVSGQPLGESGLSSLGCLSALSALNTGYWAITEQELHFQYERQPIVEAELDSFDCSNGATISSEVKRTYLEVTYWGKATKKKVFGTYDGMYSVNQQFDIITDTNSQDASGGFGLSGNVNTTQPYYERHPWNASCLPVDDGTEYEVHFTGKTFTPKSVQFDDQVLVGAASPDCANYCAVEVHPIDGAYAKENALDTSAITTSIIDKIGDMVTTANYGGMCAEITPSDGCPEYRTDVHEYPS